MVAQLGTILILCALALPVLLLKLSNMSSSKQRKTRDIRGFFSRIHVATSGDTARDKQQNLEARNELYRQQNEKDLLKVR